MYIKVSSKAISARLYRLTSGLWSFGSALRLARHRSGLGPSKTGS